MNPDSYISQLPEASLLKKICKGQAVLDWIICGEEFETYHHYFKSTAEEYEGSEAILGLNFEDESGALLHIYFVENSCLIVPGNCIALEEETISAEEFEKKIPKEFKAFYKKNFSGQDTPFVIFSLEGGPWQSVKHFATDEEIYNFNHLTADGDFYLDWASEFFDDESFLLPDADKNVVEDIYKGKILSEEMVLNIVEEVEDWNFLERMLNEIPYRFSF